MNIVQDLKTVMTGCPSVNSLVTGGIKFGHLPEDFDNGKSWIVYDYHMSEQTNTLDGNNAYSTYGIPITITATDSVVMNNISNLLIPYLNGIMRNNFIDFSLTGNSKTTVLSKPNNIYQNQLEFNAIYVG